MDRQDEWAIKLAFRDYVERCVQTMFAIFHKTGTNEIELRSWLYDSAQSPEDMVGTIHIEPLYTVAEFLGVDHTTKEFASRTEAYKNLARDKGWHERLG
jgi:hypothetical protein